jgi:integrase
MGFIYRPAITVWTVGRRRVPKGTVGATKKTQKGPTWWGRWRDHHGQEHQKRLSKSKNVAQAMLNKLVEADQLDSVGMGDPFRAHRARPLLDHLRDYAAYLRAKGNTREHCRRQAARCRAVLEGVAASPSIACPVESLTLGLLEPAAVVTWLASLREPRPLPELPARQAEFSPGELATLFNAHPQTLVRLARRLGVKAKGATSARRLPRAAAEEMRRRLARGANTTTTNHYLGAIKGFTRWMSREGQRAPLDVLTCLSKQNARADLRRVRRRLDPAEMARLLRATAEGPSRRGLTGPARAAIYVLASRSGLRRSELASLTPGSFDAAAHTVTVEAGHSKRRRRDVQPLARAVEDLVRPFVEARHGAERVWAGRWVAEAAAMLQDDLDAAGVPYEDATGKVFDFHALRHQFVSDLAANGVHPALAQLLARHSTITLTMNHYTHSQDSQLREAVDRLPPPGGPDPQ